MIMRNLIEKIKKRMKTFTTQIRKLKKILGSYVAHWGGGVLEKVVELLKREGRLSVRAKKS